MDFPFMVQTLPRLVAPLGLTIGVSLVSLLLATILGVVLGLLRVICPVNNPLGWLIDGYVELVRGTPIIIQIYAVHFLLPPLLGSKLPLFWEGVCALTLNSVGYQIEIVRAAVQSIPQGQWEAARSIGMTNRIILCRILLPQAARQMIPPLTNELSNLVKASSVLSVVALFELHKAGSSIASSSFKFVEMLALQAILYFALIQTLSWGTGYLEHHVFRYGRKPSSFGTEAWGIRA
ncbi:MAG: amino acid ABC transporter permease [Cyanobacteriota bacterium]|nr:amino acid ABC transporter permease [Cyanobacteriota bacterium]